MDDKSQARVAAAARRQLAHETVDQAPAVVALLRALEPYRGTPISGFMAIDTEIDPMPAMADLAKDGPVCVPVVEGPGRPLRFREWRPGAELVKGRFGVTVPRDGEWLTPRALIVPMLAFDRAGYRLGYGGGFYDRTLEGLRQNGEVFAIGFAFSAQGAPEVPLEPTDQPLDAIATEEGIWRPDA